MSVVFSLYSKKTNPPPPPKAVLPFPPKADPSFGGKKGRIITSPHLTPPLQPLRLADSALPLFLRRRIRPLAEKRGRGRIRTLRHGYFLVSNDPAEFCFLSFEDAGVLLCAARF